MTFIHNDSPGVWRSAVWRSAVWGSSQCVNRSLELPRVFTFGRLITILLVTLLLPRVAAVADSLPAQSFGAPNKVRMLPGNVDALQARIDLIQQATSALDVAYYAVDTGEVPVALLEMLRRASLRGISVRLLVDGFKSRLPSACEKYLRRSGMEIRIFHPTHAGRPLWLNRRLHSKVIVADSNRAIIGSRNLENEHFAYRCGKTFVDCDAWVEGPAATQAACYFQWLWTSEDVVTAPSDDSLGLDIIGFRPYGRTDWQDRWRDADSSTEFQRLLDDSLRKVATRYGVEFSTGYDWSAGATPGVAIGLLHDKRIDKSHRQVQKAIVCMIDRARCELLIESPYPAFDRRIRSAISRARRRGVRITILTNSLDSTDQLNVYAAYQNQKRSLLREGVVLREFCGSATLHAKSMIVDQQSWMIGSYNFDARSDRLNLELALISSDPVGAALLADSVRKRLARSSPISRAGILLDVGHNADLGKRAMLLLKRTYIETIRPLL